jgi:hypothetical protein
LNYIRLGHGCKGYSGRGGGPGPPVAGPSPAGTAILGPGGRRLKAGEISLDYSKGFLSLPLWSRGFPPTFSCLRNFLSKMPPDIFY